MATYVLIHGAGDVGWYWHLVEARLRKGGHDFVAPDLPCEDDSAGLTEYVATVIDAIGDRTNLVVVAQSFGGYTAPLVCAGLPTDLLVLVAGMVPAPGESADDTFANTGYVPEWQGDPSPRAVFYHDVSPDLAAEALARGGSSPARQGGSRGRSPSGLRCRRVTCCVGTIASSYGVDPRCRPQSLGHRTRRNRQRTLSGA